MMPGSGVVYCQCGLRLYRRRTPFGVRWAHYNQRQSKMHVSIMTVKNRATAQPKPKGT